MVMIQVNAAIFLRFLKFGSIASSPLPKNKASGMPKVHPDSKTPDGTTLATFYTDRYPRYFANTSNDSIQSIHLTRPERKYGEKCFYVICCFSREGNRPFSMEINIINFKKSRFCCIDHLTRSVSDRARAELDAGEPSQYLIQNRFIGYGPSLSRFPSIFCPIRINVSPRAAKRSKRVAASRLMSLSHPGGVAWVVLSGSQSEMPSQLSTSTYAAISSKNVSSVLASIASANACISETSG
jgi:hypothetical protein